MITTLPSRLFDLVCPGYCLICGESEGGSTICHDCVGRFRALLYQACPRCAAPAAPGDLPCSFCHKGRYPFEQAHALGVYRGFLRDAILFARNLGPAELLEYDRRRLKGVVLDEGSLTAHVVIVARAMGIPVLGRVRGLRGVVGEGDDLLLDADGGVAHDVDHQLLGSAQLGSHSQS